MRVPRLSETEILIASAISGKELYGLQIVDEVLALTRGKRRISLGGLYTTLHRMESKKLVTSRWGETVDDRQGARRRYYKIAGLGEGAYGVVLHVKHASRRYHVAVPSRAWNRIKHDHRSREDIVIAVLVSPHARHLADIELAVYPDWLNTAAFFVPKTIREPWLGDLREDRKPMVAAGCSSRTILWATLTQIVLLALHAAHHTLLRIICAVTRHAG